MSGKEIEFQGMIDIKLGLNLFGTKSVPGDPAF
jgi:hypothetical protein